MEKTTPRLACGNGCLRKDGLKLGWLRGKLAEVKAKVVFVQRKSGVWEIKNKMQRVRRVVGTGQEMSSFALGSSADSFSSL